MPSTHGAGSLLPASLLTVISALRPLGLPSRPLALFICSVIPHSPWACREQKLGTEGADVPGLWGVGSLDTQAPAPAHRPAPESALLGGGCPSE